MKLHDHLAVENIRIAEFGRRINVLGRATMWKYATGRLVPPPRIMVAIYLATNGVVTPNDFYDLPALPEAQQEAA